MTDNLATIAESAIDRVIGTLPMADVESLTPYTEPVTVTTVLAVEKS